MEEAILRVQNSIFLFISLIFFLKDCIRTVLYNFKEQVKGRQGEVNSSTCIDI